MMNAAAGIFLAAGRKPRLPYDAEVEYLESTGTQWIYTSIKPSSDLTTYITFSYLQVGGNLTAFGSRSTSSAQDRYWLNCDNGVFEIGYGGYVGTGIVTYIGSLNTVAFNEVANGKHTFTINGEVKTYSGTPNTSVNIIVFGRVVGDTAPVLCKMRLYSLSMKRSGDIIIDMVPVRFTNELGQSEGAMYDRLGTGGMNPDGSARTDGIYRNRGTGAFTIGPDKVA